MPDVELTAEPEVTLIRPCTRCDGQQHLVSSDAKRGFGTYCCDTCQMRVVYDLEADPPESMIFRGNPWCYSTDEISGIRLLPKELRIDTRV